jgi:hypothetical protein
VVAVVCTLLCAVPAFAQQTHLLVITGVPGDEEHAAQFQKWATSFIDAAKKQDAVPDANIIYLADKRATREGVEKAFTDLAARARPNEGVVVLLIGHGSFDGTQAAFNLPGPDLTVAGWVKLLGKLSAQRVAFVDTTSASGAFLPAVAAPGRVVVTATKTGGERNEPEFGQFFVAAFDDDAADRDRNGHVSMAEAFEYASTKVKQDYQQKSLILTEHATLEDGSEGRIASAFFLGIGRGDAALNADLSDPETKKLVDEKAALEKEIAGLQLRRPSMPEGEYSAQLEKLLTDLAVKSREVRDREGKK